MAVKVGINGFGRIGRQVLKAIRDYYPNTLEVVAFNDIGDIKTMAHLLKYDSTYGRFNGTVEMGEDSLTIDGKKVKVFKETDPAAIPWKDLGVDIVIESTGLFTDAEKATLTSKLAPLGVTVDNTVSGKSLSLAFQSLQSAKAFQ